MSFRNVGRRAVVSYLLVLFFLGAFVPSASGQVVNQLSQSDFNAIRAQYADLNLSANVLSYHVIEIAAHQLTSANLLSAIDMANKAPTSQNTLIVVRTTATQHTITLNATLNFPAGARKVTIVSLGTHPLTINGDNKRRVLSTGIYTTVALAGLTITGGSTGNDFADMGGGISNRGNLTVTWCTITKNSTSTHGDSANYSAGGGIMNYGGSATVPGATLTITNSHITGNLSNRGSGIYNAGTATITNCVIAGNRADGWNARGGGVYVSSAGTTIITNCTIAGNRASSAWLFDNTMGGGMRIDRGATVTLRNTIVFQNSISNDGTVNHYSSIVGNDFYNANGVRSSVPGGNRNHFVSIPSDSNGNVGPGWYNSANWNLRLRSDSYAIDRGSNDQVKSGVVGGLHYDIAGNARIIGATVDIGAYEFSHSTTSTTYPSPPINLRSDGQTEYSVSLRWNTSVGGAAAASYRVERSTNGTSDWIQVSGIITGTSYTDWHYAPGTTYYYRVYAVSSSGIRSVGWSNVASATTLCEAPGNFRSTSQASTSISLSWAASSGATSYRLERSSIESSNWMQVGGTITGTSYTDSTLTPNTRYQYRMCAVNNSAGISTPTSAITVITLCNAPTNLQRTNQTEASITLSWNAPTIGTVTSYRLERATNSTFTAGLTTFDGIDTTTYTDDTCSANTLYYYRVYAVNSADRNSASSNTANATSLSNAPTDWTSPSQAATSISLSWAASPGVTSYRLERSPTGAEDSWTQIGGTINTTYYDDTERDPNTTYYYRVYAVNSVGTSAPSPVITVTTLCNAPINLRSTSPSTSSRIMLAWDAPTVGTVTSYRLERSTDGTNWDQRGDIITNVFHTDSCDPNTTYYYRVYAANKVGAFSVSPSNTVILTTLCNGPTNLRPGTVTETSIDLVWDASIGGATEYRLQRASPGIDWTTIYCDPDILSYTDGARAPNMTYSYRVWAVNRVGIDSVTAAVMDVVSTLPPPPADFSGTAMANSVTLTWDAMPNPTNLTGYTLQYRVPGTPSWTTANAPGVTDTSATVDGLMENMPYEFRLMATNTSGSASAITTAKTLVSPLPEADFDEIRTKYPSFNLGGYDDYDGIVIAANQLASDTALRDAITTPSTNGLDKLIVIHTTAEQNTITLTGGELPITSGNVTIVSLGTEKLTINANRQSRVFNIGADATAELAGLTITGGNVSGNGGGIVNNGTLIVTNCNIAGNSATHSLSVGGGIHNSQVLIIMNSLISGNSAVLCGGGIFNEGGIVTVVNCTLAGNSANFGGGIYNGGTLGASNTIVAKNTLNDIYNVTNGTIVGNNNLIGDGSAFANGVNGNIVGTAANPIDPLFVEAISDDYHLTACSPAADNGSDDLAGLLTGDLDGNPRFNGTIDIGAYEYQGAVGHTYEETFYTEPTCTEDGYWTYTCTDCGNVVYEIDEGSAGHDYEEVYTDPTCTEYGYWTHTCTDCGNVVIEIDPDTAGCDFVEVYTDPTCTENGYWTHTCNDCGNVVIEIDEGSALCVCIPVNLRVVQRGQGAVSLQWNAVHDAAGYVVERECPDGEIEEFFTDVARFVDTGLAPDTTYAYSVRTLTSDFSLPIFVTTLPSTGTDVPIILDTSVNELGQTTIVWTDLGDDYVYTVYRQGQVVEQYFSGNTFTDENPPPTWATAEYAVRAYNMETGRSSGSVTTIAWNTGVRHAEFTGFEVTANGITLFWNVEEDDAYYQIMRGGVILVPSLLSDGWTDENPRASNDYELVVFYYDENYRLRRTFSNTLTVQWTQPGTKVEPIQN